MQKVSVSTHSSTLKAYCLLAKPGIILGNLITTAGAFALASQGQMSLFLFFATLMGLSCIIGSACAFNNYIDREVDKKMVRTHNRPLAKGEISIKNAVVFAGILGTLGVLILTFFTNPLALTVAIGGFLVYVVFYSFSKYRSVHGTLIGSLAGAVPPVVGYCAVTDHLDAGAWILFAMVVMWQMPHFFAIAIYRMQDYLKASIPVLPIRKGIHQTKIQMLLYILGFIAASSMLTVFGYAGYGYLTIALFLGLVWFLLCLQGFSSGSNDTHWARKMFIFSLVIVTGEFLVIPFSYTVSG